VIWETFQNSVVSRRIRLKDNPNLERNRDHAARVATTRPRRKPARVANSPAPQPVRHEHRLRECEPKFDLVNPLRRPQPLRSARSAGGLQRSAPGVGRIARTFVTAAVVAAARTLGQRVT
jgi:hypothetical protein